MERILSVSRASLQENESVIPAEKRIGHRPPFPPTSLHPAAASQPPPHATLTAATPRHPDRRRRSAWIRRHPDRSAWSRRHPDRRQIEPPPDRAVTEVELLPVAAPRLAAFLPQQLRSNVDLASTGGKYLDFLLIWMRSYCVLCIFIFLWICDVLAYCVLSYSCGSNF